MAILLDQKRCIHCGRCYDRCPEEAFAAEEDGKIYVKYPLECWLCGSCEMDCPVGAIRVTYDLNSRPLLIRKEGEEKNAV